MIKKTIDGLFIGTRYGVFAMSALGVIGSIILFFVNIELGFSSAILCIAALALCIALFLILMPKKIRKRKAVVAGICLLLAFTITGITYFTNGGFPHMNLIFISI